MADYDAGDTHYLTINHTVSGVARAGWKMSLLKNGRQITSIPISMFEEPSKVYSFSFVNDGTDRSTWTLCVEDLVAGGKYSGSWVIRRPTIEQAIKYIKSKLDQDLTKGGPIKNGE